MQGVEHHRFEMIPVFVEQGEGEILAKHRRIQRFAFGFEATDQQPAHVVADIKMAVVVRQ